MSDTLTRWDEKFTCLKHPVTGNRLEVRVNFLGGQEWEVEVYDLDTEEVIYYDGNISSYNSNWLRIADATVMYLEFN